MNYTINHRTSGAILFNLECRSLKICVEAAVKARANLAGADLADADLAGANLAGADLIDGGQDSRGFRFWAWHKDGVITYRAGCHTWTDVVAALVYYGDGYPSDGDRFDCAARLHFMHQIAQKRWSV